MKKINRVMCFADAKRCPEHFALALNDTLNVISGKWKLPILGSLMFGLKRFSELQRNIPRITPRMLSKELKELELNGMVVRKVYDAIPVLVEYELTESAKKLSTVLDSMLEWGLNHRNYSMARRA
jgi:DNA-binding HxlR family transcriptional regulator